MDEAPEQGVREPYDHMQYLEDLRDAQHILTDAIDGALSGGLEEQVDKIVRHYELMDLNGPKDGLYWATFNLVMIRLLQQQIAAYTRVE